MSKIDATLIETKINDFIDNDVNNIKHTQYRQGVKYAVKQIRKIIQDVSRETKEKNNEFNNINK